MAQRDTHESNGGDPIEALLSSLTRRTGDGGGGAPRPVQPVSVGWSLESAQGSMVELNVVTLYKKSRFAVHPNHEELGWRSCSDLKRLKQDIVANTLGCSRALIETYIGALLLVRDHVATNDVPYAYNGGRLVSPNIDFELYMTLATLAARSTKEAIAARRLQTSESYIIAYDAYMHAAQILDQARNELCTVPPPRDRVHYGNETPDWLRLVAHTSSGGGDVTVAQIVQVMDARVGVLRCEAYVSAYRAIEPIARDDPDMGETLDAAAVFVAQRFQHVVHVLVRNRRPDAPRSRMELYASFMACLFRTYSVPRSVALDLQLADSELNGAFLARALRRLDRALNPTPSQDEWQSVDAELSDTMRAALAAIDALRSRAETLLSGDTTGAFQRLDMTSISTAPLPIDPVDPSFSVVLDDGGGDATPPLFTLAALKARAAVRFADLVSFLELRTDQTRALSAIQTSPAFPDPPGPQRQGRNVGDAMLGMFADRLARHEQTAQWRAHLQSRVGSTASLLDIMAACFALGSLAERQRWVLFMFSSEEPVPQGDPPSDTMRELQEIDKAFLNAAKYLSDLQRALGVQS